MASGMGIPLKLMYESKGLKVTVETKDGSSYSGKLYSVEDTMNMRLSRVVRTTRQGRSSTHDIVFLRGSQVRFVVFPEHLRHAGMFVERPKKLGKGVGRRLVDMKSSK